MADPAEMFDEMAARIRAINPQEFAGAVLIVPPAVNGIASEPIVVLTQEATPSLEHFWGTAKVRVDHAVSEFAEELRRRQTGLNYR